MMGDFLRDMQEGITASLGVPAHVIDPSQAVPMPTTQEALLLHILQRPDDDAPRLIYADWLEEHDQPERAELIRLQCWLAKHPQDGSFVTDKLLYWPIKREIDLLTKLKDSDFFDARFQGIWRGFIAEFGGLHITQDYFLKHAAALFLAHPVERVVLEDKRPWEASLTTWGWAWLDAQGQQSSHPDYVASEIFRHIRLLAPLPRRGDIVCGFDTEQDALAALNRGCVALGRERAGLPPLTQGA